MATEDTGTKTEEKTFFARKSSGLVREFGATDALLMSTAAVFSLVFTILQFPWFYGFNQGADLATGLAIVTIPFLVLMLVYWAMGVIMPRSGNDYVWVARLISPSVGFAWSFLYMFAVLSTAFVGGTAAYASGIATSIAVWGSIYNDQGLLNLANTLSQPIYGFGISILVTLCFAGLSILGAKLVKRFIYTIWAIAVIGIVLIWALLLSTTPAAFAANWDKALSSYSTYQNIITVASHTGWTAPTITLGASLAAIPFAALFPLGGNFTNVVAGELKNTKRVLPIALILSLILANTIWAITATLTMNAFGPNWMYAVGHLWDVAPANYSATMSIAPTFPLMMSVAAYPNSALVFLVLFTIMAGSLVAPFVYFWIPSRYFFAWSFDRIIPSKIAEVNKRFRTPHYSVLSITVLCCLMFIVYWFTSWPATFTLATFLWIVCFTIPGIATMIFPYRMKELFNSSPGWMRSKIAGIPSLTILGFLTTIGFGYIGYLAVANPLITPLTEWGGVIAAAIVIACFIIYYASRSYHKSHGLDTDLAFKEIPPV
jgi:amino acid transporter